jgi:hypothetical protein
MAVEELDVRVQVFVEIAARLQRPGDRPDGVYGQPNPEDDERAEPPRREVLEPHEETPEYGFLPRAHERGGG